MGDFDGNGQLDILAVGTAGRVALLDRDGRMKRGWPQSVVGGASATPVVVRDGEGRAVMMIPSRSGELDAFTADGPRVSGFPINLGAPILASPAVWQETVSRNETVVVSTMDGTTWRLNPDGSVLPGWPRRTGHLTSASPVIADLDADAEPEVVVTSESGQVHAWHAGGAPVAGFPLALPASFLAAPVAGDLDFDARVELVLPAADGTIYRWESEATTAQSPAEVAPWPCFAGSAAGNWYIGWSFSRVEAPSGSTGWMLF